MPMKSKQADVIMWTALVISSVGYICILFSGPFTLFEMIRTPVSLLRLERSKDLYLSVLSSGSFITSYMVALSMVAMHIALYRRKHKLIFSSLAIMNITLTMVLGSRSYSMYFVGPLLFSYIVRQRKRIRATVALILIAATFIAYIGVARIFRWQDTRDFVTLLDVATERRPYETLLYTPSSHFNLRNRLFQAVKIFPGEHNWLYGNTYRTMALFWLPARLSGGLKNDTMYIFAYAVSQSPVVLSGRLSNHPTFVGDLYINFGYFFWVGAFMWGLLFGYVHKVTVLYRSSIIYTILGSTWVYFLVIAFGGSIYQSFMRLAACALFLVVAIDFLRIGLSRKFVTLYTGGTHSL